MKLKSIPQRVGTIVVDYKKYKLPIIDRHPVYLYRHFFIARNSGCAGSKTYHYEIYLSFVNNKLGHFDFQMNDEKGFRRLQDAMGVIDNYHSRD